MRHLKSGYLRNLDFCLRYPWATVGVMLALIAFTGAMLPLLGREFMPELEEGNLWVRATLPMNISLDAASAKADIARKIMQNYPEIEVVVAQTGRPDGGTDPTGFYNVEFFLPLKPHGEWPAVKDSAPAGRPGSAPGGTAPRRN